MARNKSSSALKIVDEQIDGSKPVISESQNLAKAETADIKGVREDMQDVLTEAGIKELAESLHIEVQIGESREELFYKLGSNLFKGEAKERIKNTKLFLALPTQLQKEILISYINRLGGENKFSDFPSNTDPYYGFTEKQPYLEELYEYNARMAAEKDPLDLVENFNWFGRYSNNPPWEQGLLELAARNASKNDPVMFMEHVIETYKLQVIKNEPYFKEVLGIAAKNAIEKDPENASRYIKYMNEERYIDLLEEYKKLFDRVKNLSKRQDNPNLQDKLKALDDERHQTHLKLLDIGGKLGKDNDSVLADIMRKDKTLDELGLPEFSILVENDIRYKQRGWGVSGDDIIIHKPVDSERYSGLSAESVIPIDKCLLVFNISPTISNEDISYFLEGGELEDKDELSWKPTLSTNDDIPYGILHGRAKALAEAINGEYFSEEDDAGFHETTVWITGVMFPKKDLEKVATIIRDNPEKYRLKKEFFSEEEKK